MAEPNRPRDFTLLHGVQPPEHQIAGIRDLLLSTTFCSGVDGIERMRRADCVAHALYERADLSLQEVQNTWDYCKNKARNPSALFCWRVKKKLGGWPW